MARRRSGRKLQPAVETLTFRLRDGELSGSPVTTIDLSQCASIVNRRFYRQGLNWYVAGFSLITSEGMTGNLVLKKMANTWVNGGAWEKTMRAWLKQQNDAIAETGAQSTVAKFRDFKIYLDSDHQDGTAPNHIPVDAGLTLFNEGEWFYSSVVVPNDGAPGVTNEYRLKMYGTDNANSVGMINGYQQSRAYPQSPDPVHPATYNGFLAKMFDTGDDNVDIINNAAGENDDLPYDQTNYPGATGNGANMQLITSHPVTTTTVGGKTSIGGTNVPCGLLRVEHSFPTSTVPGSLVLLQVHLVPGTHRGYMCEKMEDF